MQPKTLDTKQKRAIIKAYEQSSKIEKAIAIYKAKSTSNLQLSILKKLSQKYLQNKKELDRKRNSIESHWKEMLGLSIDFGIFSNPEIGTLLIGGSLSSMFLHQVEGKALGAMSSGVYGVLRGLGFDQNSVDTYVNYLKKGNYLLIIRGYTNELKVLEEILEKQIMK